jgi:hypothetical protein
VARHSSVRTSRLSQTDVDVLNLVGGSRRRGHGTEHQPTGYSRQKFGWCIGFITSPSSPTHAHIPPKLHCTQNLTEN